MAAVGFFDLDNSCFVFSTISAFIFNSIEDNGFFFTIVLTGCQEHPRGRTRTVVHVGVMAMALSKEGTLCEVATLRTDLILSLSHTVSRASLRIID
jgi:hypothetical protein